MNPIQMIKKVTKTIAKFITLLPFIIKLFIILALAAIISVVFDWIVNVFLAEDTPKAIYEIFEVTDMKELIEIKKSPDGSGYYLDFIEDFDEKVDAIMERANYGKSVHTLTKDKNFLKKIIKAEVITQFPNLGGNIPENSDGFQGVIDIRRITPNKQIGSIDDNPGKGETTTIEPEITYDIVDDKLLYEEKVKSWNEGQVLYIISKAIVYAQRESQLHPGEDTGSWYVVKKEDNPDEDVTIPEGTQVTYTGTYKKNINPLDSSLSEIYVEVKTEKSTVYVNASVLETTKKESEERKEATSRAKEEERDQGETIGKEGKNYTIAIAAGHNNTDNKGARSGSLIEEELTIKTAEKVEELLKKYTNITVVQVGSTSSNPGGIKVGERTKKAREKNPDLCIQIHYNAGGGTGVEAIYKNGDGISQQLAEILSESMASSMGLPNRFAGSDTEKSGKNLGIIENAASSGFPSVVTEGGFVDGEPDASLLKNDGTDKCAQGIVNGIIKYLGADHIGYTSTNVINQTAQESIDSKVYNLKYIKLEELEELLTKANNGDSGAKNEILKVYTLDKDNKLVTTTWESENDKITYKKNSSMNLESSLKKYIMPYEYLLYFYMDTNETDFSEKLAEEVFNTEIVIAVQDNINTTKTVKEDIQWTEAEDSAYSKGEEVASTTTTTIEVCNPKIEITYADTWCIKFFKENSYSRKALNWGEGDREEGLDIKGKVDTSSNESETSGNAIASGTHTITHEPEDEDEEPTYTYVDWVTYQKTKTLTDNMTITYDTGEATIHGNENKFVDLYQKCKMQNWVRTDNLLEMIENNQKIANLLDLTKYLMYKATNNFYGVVEFDFSEYDLKSFTNIDGDYGEWDGTGSNEDFIKAVAPYAVIDMEQHQVYASVTIAQAIIESGWGKNPIATQYKNFFGMKAKGSANEFWSGDFVTLPASEGGTANFRVYDGLKNSVYDHGRNFSVTTTYSTHGVLDCIPQNLGPKEQLKRIAESGYAIDGSGNITVIAGKRYDEHLYQEFIVKYNLTQYDSMSSSDFKSIGSSQIVDIAKTKLGSQYVYGTAGPDTFDCSGLVQWVYKQVGISLPRSTSGYPSYIGSNKEVSWEEAQPGDIVWKSGHMGIYLGDDKYIHAPETGDVVKISSNARTKFTNVFRFSQ